jgi:hypothetical protein
VKGKGSATSKKLGSGQLKMNGPDTSKPGGPGGSKKVGLGGDARGKHLAMEGPGLAGGGWVKK